MLSGSTVFAGIFQVCSVERVKITLKPLAIFALSTVAKISVPGFSFPIINNS